MCCCKMKMNYVYRDDNSTHERCTKKDEQQCYISQLTDGLFLSQENLLVSSSCSVFGKKFLPVVSSNSLPRTNLHTKSSASTSTTECKRTPKSKKFDFELKRPSATENRGQDKGTSPATSMPKRKTWQELSAEINQFAEQNIRNAGWELRTSKQKSRSETDLFYLTSQTTPVIHKAEKVLQDSLETQQKLQAWDKKMGLKRCHSRTMTKSSITRKQLLQHLRELKMQMRADHQGSNNSPIDFENAVANLPR